MDKKSLRSIIKAKKQQLTNSEIRDFSDKLTEAFLSLPQYTEAPVIFTYMAYNQELLTDKIICNAWEQGKQTAVPRVHGTTMEFYYINSFDELNPGYCGIPEPISGEAAVTDSVLMIMPGIAFDRFGNRIGYGGGFYDRYLASHHFKSLTTIALAYDFQIYDCLEAEQHDYPTDIIITPSELILSGRL